MDEVLIIMGYKLPDGTVDDVYDDLMEGQKLMSIVKAERQSHEDIQLHRLQAMNLPHSYF